MQNVNFQKIISKDGVLILNEIPFKSGDLVNVMISKIQGTDLDADKFPLKNTVIKYEDPFESAAADDWEVMK